MGEEFNNSGYYYQQAPVYEQPENNEPRNYGLAVTSLVLGIVSLVFFACGINIITSIASIILGSIFLAANSRRSIKKGRGFAITGIITSLLSIIFFIAAMVIIFSNIDKISNMFEYELRNNPEFYYDYNYEDGFDDYYNFYDSEGNPSEELEEFFEGKDPFADDYFDRHPGEKNEVPSLDDDTEDTL